MFKTTKLKSDTSSNLIIKKKRSTYLWLAEACLIVVLIIGYFNKSYFYISYYYLSKFKHFSKGDNVYVSQAYVDEKKLTALLAMQLIEPLTQAHLDTMHISQVSKSLNFKINTNPNSKAYAAMVGSYFSIDSLRKYHSRRIGVFIGYDWVSVKDITGKGFVTVLLCAVKPDLKFLSLKGQLYNSFIPSGYILSDTTIYVDPFQLSEK